MEPEILITIVAAFVGGGALGSAGTLLAQWILRGAPTAADRGLSQGEGERLRRDVVELHRHLHNLDARLEFTERLLDGGLPTAPPPARMPAPELPDEGEGERVHEEEDQDGLETAGPDTA